MEVHCMIVLLTFRDQYRDRSSIGLPFSIRNRLGTIEQGHHGKNFVRFQLFLVFVILNLLPSTE